MSMTTSSIHSNIQTNKSNIVDVLNNNAAVNAKDQPRESVADNKQQGHSIPATNTKISKNREQFDKYLEEKAEKASDEEVKKEKEREIASNLSPEEVAMLKRMQVDVNNTSLSELAGILTSMRSSEHKADVAEYMNKATSNEDKPDRNVQVTDNRNIDISMLMDTIKQEGNEPIIDNNQAAYIIKNDMDLTLDNLYKSHYSAREGKGNQSISEDAWREILPQIEDIIVQAGLELNDTNYDAARWMISNELPFNVDSLRQYKAIDNINTYGIDQAVVDENMQALVDNNIDPAGANIYYENVSKRAEKLVNSIANITDIDIAKTVNSIYPENLVNMIKAADMPALDMTTFENIAGGDQYIQAKRQLEEIRLMMTSEASIRLLDSDINIDTRPLKEVVDKLIELEKESYREMFSAMDVEFTDENIDLYKETNQKTNELPYMPSYSLGAVIRDGKVTISTLHARGNADKASFADSAYETMMTKPRGDMGDSIKKAFRNVDNIIEDLGLEVNNENQRAVRILAYNQMEINEDSVMQVKSADLQVNTLLENMNPATVLSLIREGINPLDTPIEELNNQLEAMSEEIGVTDEDRYSKFLYKLEKNNEISEEERASFIGIYRLLDKVSKSDGKDLGYLVNSGRDITMNNLLSAHRSGRHTGLDVNIDDGFGGLEDSNNIRSSISEQIAVGFNSQLTKSILERITPETLSEINKDADIENMSLEALYDNINNLPDSEDVDINDYQYEQDILEEFKAIDKEVIQQLEAYDIPTTFNNVMAADIVFNQRGSVYDKARKILDNQDSEQYVNTIDSILEETEGFDDISKANSRIQANISELVHEKEVTGHITSEDISSLKLINAGFNILHKVSESKQYQIPVNIDGQINVINLTVVKDENISGNIRATMESDTLGNITADINVSNNVINGYITSDNVIGNDILRSKMPYIYRVMEDLDIEVDNISIGSKIEAQTMEGGASTAQLYRVTKCLVGIIKEL